VVDQRGIVTGHTHLQFDRSVAGRRSINPGSVGLPYHEGRPGTAYWALLGPTVQLRQTGYDVDAALERGPAVDDPSAEKINELLLGRPTPAEIIADAESRVFSDECRLSAPVQERARTIARMTIDTHGGDPRPRFSIVIPCLNEADYLADTVRSLRDQTFAGRYEIVVVDNNSTDDTAAIARSLGVRVVPEPQPGVCWARQCGSLAATGEIVVSADADTWYAPDWLATIDRTFGTDEAVVAVAGPCRYVGGPRWGRAYARMLFATVHFGYRFLDRPFYVTATNIAFRRNQWTGYDVHLTQGGDELGLLRQLRSRGQVRYVHTNPTYTSSRRLTRGPLYGLFVTVLVYYLLGYGLNRWFKRRVIGSAPAFRMDRSVRARRVQNFGVAVVIGGLLLLPSAGLRRGVMDTSHSLVDFLNLTYVRPGSR